MKTTQPTVFSINFHLKTQRGTHGKHPLYVRLTINNKRAEIATSLSIEPEYWCQKSQVALVSSLESTLLNEQLDIIRGDVQKHYNRLIALDASVTAETLKNEYKGISERHKTLNDLMELYFHRFSEKVECGIRSTGTRKCIITTIGKVRNFIKHRFRRNDLLLNEVLISFASDFEHYLVTKDRLCNNSAMKYIGLMKRMIKFGVDQGWMATNPVAQFKCPYQEPERERLTIEEVMVLFNKNLPIRRLAEVRDVFVFCCFTGFCYIDVFNLTQQNIIIGIDGKKWIMKSRVKTKSQEHVPLLPVALLILERYKNDPCCIENNKLLPVDTNQCYNAYLKEVAILCGINKYLTTHIARHTFATSITLENDVPIETVSKMLGHRSIRTTQIYAKVTQRKISNNMLELEKKLLQREELNLRNNPQDSATM